MTWNLPLTSIIQYIFSKCYFHLPIDQNYLLRSEKNTIKFSENSWYLQFNYFWARATVCWNKSKVTLSTLPNKVSLDIGFPWNISQTSADARGILLVNNTCKFCVEMFTKYTTIIQITWNLLQVTCRSFWIWNSISHDLWPNISLYAHKNFKTSLQGSVLVVKRSVLCGSVSLSCFLPILWLRSRK